MALIKVIDSLTNQEPLPNVLVTVALALLFLYFIFNFQTPSRSLPIINARKPFEFSNTKLKERYRTHAKELLESGLQKSKSFWLYTDKGPRLVLANEYAREIHGNPHLSLSRNMEDELHCDIPGMEAYRTGYFPAPVGNMAIKTNLRRSFESLLKPLSREASSILDAFWSANTEWHKFPLSPLVLDMISQLTAEMRSGKDLAQSPQWRRLSVSFTVNTFIAAADLDSWPRILRHVVHWFLPSCKRVRADIEEAHAVYDVAYQARVAEKRAAVAKGVEPPVYKDMMEWMEEHAQGQPFDAVLAQLLVAQAMIHGTADLTTQAIFDIVERPELVEQMRAEILSVVGEQGLTMASLSNLHLMDSVIKESQRLKPLFLVVMKRYAERSITLSDGVVIPKGSHIVVHMQNMWDESHYADPLEFQSHRFLERRRVPGQETAAQLASATVDHMGFSYGLHSCPGRRIAAAMIKLLLCHILLKYDVRLVGGKPDIVKMGVLLIANPGAEIEVRRRQEELDFDALAR